MVLIVGGYLLTLPGSATATSTIQFTTGISSTTSATHTDLSTSMPPKDTTENGEIPTQETVFSTTKSVATTNVIDSSSTLETITKSPTTDIVSSMETSGGYSTAKLPQQTSSRTTPGDIPSATPFEESTEHLTTFSTADMSAASTESLTSLQGSTSSPMGNQTSSTEIPSTSPYTSSDQNTYISTEMVTSQTHFTPEVETFSNAPDSSTTSSTKHATTAISTSIASSTTKVTDTSGSSTSMHMTTMTKGGTSRSTSPTFVTSTAIQTPVSLISEDLTTTMAERGTTSSYTSPKATPFVMSTTSQTSLSSKSFNTPEDLTAITTEFGTTAGPTSRMTTASQSVPDRSANTSPNPTTSPSYPPRTLANIESDEAEKKIQIEIEVSEVSSEGCVPDNKKSCENFTDTVIVEFQKFYQEIHGFIKVEVINLRSGSIIVVHEVSYKYNEMEPEDKGLTAQQVYDKTVRSGVQEGMLGVLTVVNCKGCKEPQDLTNLCNFKDSVDCGVYVAQCIQGYVYCVSPCHDNSFCSSRGDCYQDEGEAAKCSCHSVDNGFYYGDNCEHYFNQTVTIVCIAVAGGFIFGIAVACSVTRCRRKKRLGRYRQYYMDDMGEEGYLCRNESYAVDGALEGEEDLIDFTSDDDPKLEFTFNSSLTAHTD